jgi:hypothetical protein
MCETSSGFRPEQWLRKHDASSRAITIWALSIVARSFLGVTLNRTIQVS